jgi:hypothetical protein
VTYTSFFLPSSPPSGTFAFAGTGFELAVTDLASGQPITTFAPPLTVTIEYTEFELDGMCQNTLGLLYWSGSEWLDDGIAIVEHDLGGNRLVVTVEHLTEFALFGEHTTYLPLVMRGCP